VRDAAAGNLTAGLLAAALVAAEMWVARSRPPHRGREQDRGTRAAITVGLVAGFAGALACANAGVGPAIAGGRWTLVAAGTAIAVAGLVLRAWAIATLGHLFQQRLVIQDGHAVVASGPYRVIRHPSYAGPILVLAGIGVALGSWLGLVVSVALPFAGYAARIVVEERMLVEGLGAEYEAYRARTWRLVPGIW